ncbi:hypothetical protein OB446_013150 [Paenibacillus alvei]|nr:hypothetical protein [Paenibacillus alvei]EJW18051.1 hypothetical protein PAV_3c05010 [Paenibacillus alvei DSM 29]MEC0080490.1 hypothetical protein [Paenibacillus alvei]
MAAEDDNHRIILLIVLIVGFVSFAFGIVKGTGEEPAETIIP